MRHGVRVVVVIVFFLAGSLGVRADSSWINVTTPDLSAPLSGTFSLMVSAGGTVDSSPGVASVFYYIFDGGNPEMPAGGQPPCTCLNYYHWRDPISMTDTFAVDTTKLANGPHVMYISAKSYSGTKGYLPIGTYGPVNFSTNNGRIPWELRANYRELWMTPGQTVMLTPKLIYTDRSASALPLAAYTSSNASIAVVDSAGTVTAQAVGDVAITLAASGLTSTVLVHVNVDTRTPHFGKDGSLLLAYDPAKSTFVRDVFAIGTPRDSQLISDMKASAVNTFETAIYTMPQTSTFAQWATVINQTVWQPIAAAVAQDFNVLFTAEDIARGDAPLYEATRGASASWSPNPIIYALNWAKSLGRAIGIDTVDEVSFIYGTTPQPQGRMGQPGGPQQIVCVNNACTVTWPEWQINAGWRFLIRNATSNLNLNVNITRYYTLQRIDGTTFSFSATNVGTQTFTAATDPDLTLEIYAYEPHGSDGLDYVHNDAFTVLMNLIHQADGNRPPLTWPVAGDTPQAVKYWAGDPFMSDYTTMYWSFLSQSYPWGSTLQQALFTFDYNFASKYPQVQRNRPIIWLSPGTGPQARLVTVPTPVSRIINETILFSQPHGVLPFTPTLDYASVSPRFVMNGSSNPSLDGKYYIYAIVNATAVKVFLKDPQYTNDTAWGGTVTFADGLSCSIYYLSVVHQNTQQLFLSSGGNNPACFTQQAGQEILIMNNSYAPLNGKWYVQRNRGNGGAILDIAQLPRGTGSGGTASIVYNNYPAPTNDGGQYTMVISDTIMWAAAKGMAGVRVYGFTENGDLDKTVSINQMFPGDPGDGFIQPGINPRNDPAAVVRWNAMAQAFRLIAQIEPYLLQQRLHAPDYGAGMVSAARTSSYGNLLMVINFLETNVTETIDLQPYLTGAPGTRYRMTGTSLSQETITGAATQTATFLPGETMVWVFPLNGTNATATPQRILTINPEGTTLRNFSGQLQFLSTSTHAIIATIPFSTNYTGHFLFSLPSGLPSVVDVRISIPGYLMQLARNQDAISPAIIAISSALLLAGDFNGDGSINSLDWSTMNRNWFGAHALADINRDGIVNSLDFSFLSKNWLVRGE